jgi:eukaryotic-like serine/threonine-protein kinase
MTLAAGSRLGPYAILGAIGAGGMGEVWRAKDPRLGRDVAIKVLPASLSQDSGRLRRFEQEARAAGMLNHPNIMAVYDTGSDEGAPYVVCELLEGETLRTILAGGRLSSRKAIDYALQVAHGLAAAHEKGIVHRDLKPENLFVTRDSRVKILDFGLAKLTHVEAPQALSEAATESALTEPGVVLGTVGYMSPEQVRGQGADARSDIFALGVVLYEMLAGQRAFPGATRADVLSAVLKEEPPVPPPGASLPPGLERVLLRCLEKGPGERFQSARDLAFALQDIPNMSSDAPAARARARPILWLGLLALAAAAAILVTVNPGRWRERLAGGSAHPAIRSLAVLPLENLSHDPNQEFFADGMTEVLISNLARVHSLRVISRTSVMRYKGTRQAVPEIARELGVEGIVEGSVLRVGDRVRITAQLIHAGTDAHLWGEEYERDAREVLALQGDVARAITREVQARLTPEEQTRLAAVGSVNVAAHEAYLKGRYYWNKRTAEAVLTAIGFFEQSVAADARFAPAHAGLANCYVVLGGTGISAFPPNDVGPKARAAALKALSLDESLGEAHAALGYAATTYVWEWAAAEREFERAIALDPGYATAHFWYGVHLAARGRTEKAISEVKQARALDPLSPIIHAGVAWIHHLARRYDEAMEDARKSLEIDPAFLIGHFRLGAAYERKASYDDAIDEIRKAIAASGGNPDMIAALGHALAASGRRDEARGIADQLIVLRNRRYVSAYSVAAVYSGLAEKDRAFEWLQKALEERSWSLAFVAVDPDMDPLRSDPRLAELIQKLGLAPST